MTRLETTHHTVRCPLEDCIADLSVRSDPGAAPSVRHRDVIACSLRPSTSLPPVARRGYLPDVAPPMSYHYEVGGAPCQGPEIRCGRHCLAVLNAAEAGVAELPLSGDALELARLTQTPAMMRLVWSYCGG